MPLQPMGIKAVAEGVGQFNKKVDSMNKSITKSNKSMDEAEKSGASFSDVLGKLGVAAGIATGAFVAVQKALEFGRKGALITQTGESFEFLLEKIGAAPDLLSQLQEASKGTITDLQLMSSTATLLAGAGDELATKLANATPRLLEIAKAANKLNPALGDTAFLYQSIATGVKRAQPLILDNLGITIKVGEANEAFAKSIGKTVEELNAEEKAMAILAGTLKAGGNLIDQVGGNTDSLTDDFDRASVAITQAGDALKTKLAPFLARAADGLFQVLTQADRMIVALEEQEQLTRESAGSWEEYNDEMLRLENVTGRARDRFGGLNSELDFLIATFTDADAPTRQFANTLGAIATEIKSLGPVTIDLNLSLAESSLASASRRLFQWSQDQQNALRLEAHIEITTALAEAGGGAQLPEFQHGGQFVVGGKSGVDQNLVAFKASRGEVVTVTPTSNVDNRSVTTGDINMGGGGMSPQSFDRMMRDWIGA